MTLVSSANIVTSGIADIAFIFWGRLFIYIMNSRGPRIDRWGTPCISVLQSEKTFGDV